MWCSRVISLVIFSCLLTGIQAQSLPNANFEDWEFNPLGFAEPMGWCNSNDTIPGAELSVAADITAFNGLYSLTAKTRTLGIPFAPHAAFIVNGNTETDILTRTVDLSRAGTPISSKPAALDGYWHYTAGEAGDSAEVILMLTHWNAGLGQRDTVAYATHKLGQESWFRSFSLPFGDLMPGVSPDTVVVAFFSSNLTNPKVGSELWLDDLSLEAVVGIEESSVPAPELKVWPNPVAHYLNIQSSERFQEIQFLTLSGKTALLTGGSGTYSDQIDLRGLAPGIYFAKIQFVSGAVLSKRVVISR